MASRFSKPLTRQNTGLSVHAIANLSGCLQRTHRGMLGSIDVAQIPRIYREAGWPFSFSSCHTEFLWELRVLQLCTRMFPFFRRFALLSGALAGIKAAEGTNGFPCILNSLLYWFFLCHLKFNIGKIPVHHLNQ